LKPQISPMKESFFSDIFLSPFGNAARQFKIKNKVQGDKAKAALGAPRGQRDKLKAFGSHRIVSAQSAVGSNSETKVELTSNPAEEAYGRNMESEG